jgi:hypothetical protein
MRRNMRLKTTVSIVTLLGALLASAMNSTAAHACSRGPFNFPLFTNAYVSTSCLDSDTGVEAIGTAGRDRVGNKTIFIECSSGNCNSTKGGRVRGETSTGSAVCTRTTTATGGSNGGTCNGAAQMEHVGWLVPVLSSSWLFARL